MATLIIDHSQNCLENSPREGLKKKLNMAFPSHFLLVFYFIGFSPTIACVPTVTWHCTTAELFQKTSGASVTTLEVNDHSTNNASGPCDERPFAFSVYPCLLYVFTCFNPSQVCSIQTYRQPIPALFPLSFDYSWPRPLSISSPRCPSHFSDLIDPHLPWWVKR